MRIRMGNAKGRLAAFSLLELLVAIVVIGILSGLLLPALARSKASSRSSLCLNQLRQIGLALQVYVDENDNRLPVMYDAPIGTNALLTNALLPTVSQVMQQFLDATNLLRCPSDDRQIFQQTGSSYAWNTLLNGQDADSLRLFGMALATDQIPLLFDKQSFHREKGDGRGVNYLYADGHIKNLFAIENAK